MIREDVLLIMIMLDWGVVPCNRHPYNIGSSPHVARQLKTIYSEQDMVVSIQTEAFPLIIKFGV